jgi:hypothetical protein
VEAGVQDIMNNTIHQKVAMGQEVFRAQAECMEVE